jgi:hypothetical protein
MSANADPRRLPGELRYSYRRPLDFGELIPAIGLGVGVGFLAYYVARVLTERTPLLPEANRVAADRTRLRRGPRGPG